MHALQQLFAEPAPNMITALAPKDDMYEGSTEHYFSVGNSALCGVKLAMLAAGKTEVNSILDFGCGHGRVLRALKAAFPQARLTACDLLPDALEFCAATFGAVPVASHQQPDRVRIAERFDLIWCGTLLTNLSLAGWVGFLRLFHSLLAPGGVLVFTTHGRFVAERIRRRECTYGVDERELPGLLADYDRDGFGFRNYPRQLIQEHFTVDVGDYGINMQTPAWVFGQLNQFPDLRLLTFTERGWDNHQDMIGCAREPG